jgi:hypothetical protein
MIFATAKTSKLDEFYKSFSEYVRYNEREQGALVENRLYRIRWNLFQAFKSIAPTAQRIEDESRQALETRGLKRREGKDGNLLSAEKEIKARKLSRMFLASSFVVRGWKKSKDGQARTFIAKGRGGTKTGQVRLRTKDGNKSPSGILESFLEGAVIQDDARGIVDNVLAREIVDIQTYILKKNMQKARSTIARVF